MLDSAAKTNIARADHNTLIEKLNEGKAIVSEITAQGLEGHESFFLSLQNYIVNAGMEYWPDGGSSVPFNWNLTGSGSPAILQGSGSSIGLDEGGTARITAHAADTRFFQDITVNPGAVTVKTLFQVDIGNLQNKFSAVALVKTSYSDIKLYVEFSDATVTEFESVAHPADDEWTLLKVSGIVDPTGPQSFIRVGILDDNVSATSIYFLSGIAFFLGDVPFYLDVGQNDLNPMWKIHKNESTEEPVRVSFLQTGNDEAVQVAANYMEVAITFPSAFKEVKSIVLTTRPESGDIAPAGDHQLVVHVYSTSGFTARYYGSGFAGSETMNFSYIAIGTMIE